MKLMSKIAVGCLSVLLAAPPVYSMTMEFKSMDPADPLKINGIQTGKTGGAFKLIRHSRIDSFLPNTYVYESLSTYSHDGKEYNIVIVGLTDKNSPTTHEIARFYDKSTNKLVETASVEHVEDHPHTTTFSATTPKN